MVYFLSMSCVKIKYDRYVTKLVLMFGVFFLTKKASIIPILFCFLLYYVTVHVFNLILLENTELKITVVSQGDFSH